MKARRIIAALLAVVGLSTGAALAQAYLPGDVTGILGTYPLFPNGVRVSQINQQSAGQFAQRAALVAGTYTFTFSKAYNAIPACTVTGEAAANINTIRAVPSTSSVVVTSYSAANTVASTDTQFVDIHCDGNPN